MNATIKAIALAALLLPAAAMAQSTPPQAFNITIGGTYTDQPGNVYTLSMPTFAATITIKTSVDGSTSTAPHGPALGTAAGVWTWGAPTPNRPGENQLLLNGVYAPGDAGLMEVAHGGNLYVHALSNNQWYIWQNGSFTQSPAP